MQGRRAKWIFGTDHAGIATQMQVEKQLEARARRREELGREAFIERVWEWRERVRRHDRRAVPARSAPRSTTPTSASRWTTTTCAPSRTCSCACYEKGYIYRDNYMVNWDPGLALGDLGPRGRAARRSRTRSTWSTTRSSPASGSVTVATVRPETMLADTAIAVQPGRRALHAPDRRDGDPAARRAAAADHRRRVRGPRVRHRRAQDHARPRPERLRDRPHARPRRGDRDRRGRPHDRRRWRALRRAWRSTRRAHAVVAALREEGLDLRHRSRTCTTCRTRTARAGASSR